MSDCGCRLTPDPSPFVAAPFTIGPHLVLTSTNLQRTGNGVFQYGFNANGSMTSVPAGVPADNWWSDNPLGDGNLFEIMHDNQQGGLVGFLAEPQSNAPGLPRLPVGQWSEAWRQSLAPPASGSISAIFNLTGWNSRIFSVQNITPVGFVSFDIHVREIANPSNSASATITFTRN